MATLMALKVNLEQTYEKLSGDSAPLSRDGRRKVHKWSLSINGRALFEIARVSYKMHPSFDPQEYIKETPPFKTVQTSYGFFSVKVTVETRDGVQHDLGLFPIRAGRHSTEYTIRSAIRKRSFGQIVDFRSEPCRKTFGVELELTHDTLTPELFGRRVDTISGFPIQTTRDPSFRRWSIVHDSSVQCSANQLGTCSTFELVSPKLQGLQGFEELRAVVDATDSLGAKVNRIAGFHVHVDARSLSFAQVRHLAQAFLKYETVFDMLVPPSRRGNANQYCLSNMQAVSQGIPMSGADMHKSLEEVRSLPELVELFSPSRYYKLNLQNLLGQSGKCTVEFRQHSGTSLTQKVEAWVRLVLLFVHAACERPSAQAFKSSTPVEERFECLFDWVVKDRDLHEYYTQRRAELHSDAASSTAASSTAASSTACCSGRLQSGGS